MPSRSELLQSAKQKRADGRALNKAERAAVASYRKERGEKLRWQHYAECSQKDYRQLSGRQTKQLQELAERYGMPVGGKYVDLARTIRWFHDYFAKWGSRNLGKGDFGDELLDADDTTDNLEWYRGEKARIAQLQRMELEGQLLPADDVEAMLDHFAEVVASTCDALEHEYGPGARAILDSALADLERGLLNEAADAKAEMEAEDVRRKTRPAREGDTQADNPRVRRKRDHSA